MLLVWVLGLGGLLAPVLHHTAHAVNHHDDGHPSEFVLIAEDVDFWDCELCDLQMTATSESDDSVAITLSPQELELLAPVAMHFSSVALPLTRAPPVIL